MMIEPIIASLYIVTDELEEEERRDYVHQERAGALFRDKL